MTRSQSVIVSSVVIEVSITTLHYTMGFALAYLVAVHVPDDAVGSSRRCSAYIFIERTKGKRRKRWEVSQWEINASVINRPTSPEHRRMVALVCEVWNMRE